MLGALPEADVDDVSTIVSSTASAIVGNLGTVSSFDSFFMAGREGGTSTGGRSEDRALELVCRIDLATEAPGPGVVARFGLIFDSFFTGGRVAGAGAAGGSEDCALRRVCLIDLAPEASAPGVGARVFSIEFQHRLVDMGCPI